VGREGAVTAAGDVEEWFLSEWVKLRVEETYFLTELLIEQCDEACPEWGYGAGAADDFLLAVDENLIPGFRRRIPGNVGNAATTRACSLLCRL
jgi:hypothetical protein